MRLNMIVVFFIIFLSVSFAVTNVSSCQELNITGETYVLNQTLTVSFPFSIFDRCLNVSAPDIILDGQNNIMDSANAIAGAFIYTNSSNTTIKNFRIGIIGSQHPEVVVINSTGNNLDNLTFYRGTSNTIAMTMIYVLNDSNNLTNITIAYAGEFVGLQRNIFIYSSFGSPIEVISNNNILDNISISQWTSYSGQTPFILISGTGNTLKNVKIHDATTSGIGNLISIGGNSNLLETLNLTHDTTTDCGSFCDMLNLSGSNITVNNLSLHRNTYAGGGNEKFVRILGSNNSVSIDSITSTGSGFFTYGSDIAIGASLNNSIIINNGTSSLKINLDSNGTTGIYVKTMDNINTPSNYYKYTRFFGIVPVSIANISLNYTSVDLSSNPAIEDKLDLYNYSGGSWTKTNATLNMTSKTINYTNIQAGTYALLSYPTECIDLLNITRTGSAQIQVGDASTTMNGIYLLNNTCTHTANNTFYDANDSAITNPSINITNNTPTNFTLPISISVTTSKTTGIAQYGFTGSINDLYRVSETYAHNISNVQMILTKPDSYENLYVYTCSQTLCDLSTGNWVGASYSIVGANIIATGEMDDIAFVVSSNPVTTGGGTSSTPISPETPPVTVEEPPPETPPPEPTPTTPPPETVPVIGEVQSITPSAGGDSVPLAIKEVAKSAGIEVASINYTCPRVFQKLNFISAATFDRAICETKGVLSLYPKSVGSFPNVALILTAFLSFVSLSPSTHKKPALFYLSASLLVIVVVLGFNFLTFSATAIILSFGGKQVM